MTTRKSSLWLALVPAVLVALALMAVLVTVSGAQPLKVITVSELDPPNGATVAAGQPITVSAFIESDVSIDTNSVSVLLDGSRLDVQLVVGSRAERVGFNTTRTFAAGSHTLTVTAKNTNGETAEAKSTFTAAQSAATTTAPATAATTAAAVTTATTVAAASAPTVAGAVAAPVTQLPAAGGMPVDLAILALLGLGSMAAGIGLRGCIR